jgi:hypothetical protein
MQETVTTTTTTIAALTDAIAALTVRTELLEETVRELKGSYRSYPEE